MRTIVFVVMLVILATAGFADFSVLQRTDTIGSGKPCYTFGLTDNSSGLEFWGLGLPDFPDYEIGKTWLAKNMSDEKTQVFFSAYAVSWPKAEPRDQYFLLPWPSLVTKVGSSKVEADVFVYLPVNGGPFCVGSNNTSVTWSVNEKLRLGLSASYWKQQGCEVSSGIGPIVNYKFEKNSSLTIRYIPESLGTDQSFRLQFNTLAF